MGEPEDMGFLAEDACRELARAICPHIMDPREAVHKALRRFMAEAKKSLTPTEGSGS